MRRFFAFGCSFTKWRWAMWPEIINCEFQPEVYENHGVPGAGNQFIAHQVAIADQKHKFNKDDLVMICWTHVFRKDWYIPNGHHCGDNYGIPGEFHGWECGGNIFTADHKLNAEVPDCHKIPSDYLARDSLLIYNTMRNLNDAGVPNYQMQISEIFNRSGDNSQSVFHKAEADTPQITPLTDYCNQYIKTPYENHISTDQTWLFYLPEDREHGALDYHPMPTDHVRYLEEACDIPISTKTKDISRSCEEQVFEYIKSQRQKLNLQPHEYMENFSEDMPFKSLC